MDPWRNAVTATVTLHLLLLILLCHPSSSSIIEPPSTMVVTTGESATFSCKTGDGYIVFTVNNVVVEGSTLSTLGIIHETQRCPMRTEDGQVATITFNAQPSVNNSNITCYYSMEDSMDCTSNTVQLIIQGLLAAPGGLAVNSLSLVEIQLTWNAPFSLDLTNTAVDISGYTLYITNVNISQTEEVNITDLGSDGTVMTEYTFMGFNVESLDPCQIYEYAFSVSASNGAGEGVRSGMVHGLLRGMCSSTLVPILPSFVTTVMPTQRESTRKVTPLPTKSLESGDNGSSKIGLIVGLSVGLPVVFMLIGAVVVLIVVLGIGYCWKKKKFCFKKKPKGDQVPTHVQPRPVQSEDSKPHNGNSQPNSGTETMELTEMEMRSIERS